MAKQFLLSVKIITFSSVLLGCAPLQARPCPSGTDQATVPAWEWITVVNDAPVYSGNNTFTTGETCGIQEAGTVHVIGRDETEVLVCYTAPRQVFGTPCPTGTEFLLSKDRFAIMTDTYRAIQKQRKEQDARIKKMRQHP